jgi:hypothetical protein
MRKLGSRMKSGDKLRSYGIDPKEFETFQANFMRLLRITNILQALYISM